MIQVFEGCGFLLIHKQQYPVPQRTNHSHALLGFMRMTMKPSLSTSPILLSLPLSPFSKNLTRPVASPSIHLSKEPIMRWAGVVLQIS